MSFCIPFEELTLADVPLVGGKNASLGELVRALAPLGVRLPPGFAVTADGYSALLAQSDTAERLRATLDGVDPEDVADLAHRAAAARAVVRGAGLPTGLAEEIRVAYRDLCARGTTEVAVRSSATAEDLPDASFAGQQETFLNIRGEDALLDACLGCFASLFTARAISYRASLGFDHLAVRLSVGVQRMVRSDLGSAGVVFTLDPESGFRDVVLVTGAWGLGESVVAGRVDPDEIVVFKPTLETATRPILRRRLGAKQEKVVYARGGSRTTRIARVGEADRQRFCFSDDDAIQLARWAVLIERHYSAHHGRPTPMDLEWAKDGRTGELFIVQARPETVESRRPAGTLDRWTLGETGEVLLCGRAIGNAIGAGCARIVRDVSELGLFQPGDVLVAEMTDPDWVPVMRKAAAIITDGGGRTCHAAIVSRELGVPCIVGTGSGTTLLAEGQSVTVSCADGTEGHVYRGVLRFAREAIDVGALPHPRTKVLVNLADPETAFAVGQLPVDGVGLAREEFIIANEIGVHPMALVFPERVDEATRTEIARRARNHASPAEWFVSTLAEGIGMIAAAFYPRPVIVRLSDFKTNEYAGLLGGAPFEPKEENPMLGFRGASRYADDRYRDGFALECHALHRVREDMGLRNVKLMVPFCRTPAEGRRVIEELATHGLVRGQDGLEVWVMCELPANVVLIDAFAEVFDGFSIGSNDLTQLVLGIDRDSAILAGLFDERDPAVTRTLAAAIRGAHAAGRPIGICGQAPSDWPEIAQLLVREGVDSVSLNPDAVLRILPVLVDEESR
ncbi:MAG: phosphoenolpyruvate synthase [Myxococcota bacterium]